MSSNDCKFVKIRVHDGGEEHECTEQEGTTVSDIKEKFGVPSNYRTLLDGNGFNNCGAGDSQELPCGEDDLTIQFMPPHKDKGSV